MLLSILHCTGQTPTTRTGSAPDQQARRRSADLEGLPTTPGVAFLALLFTDGGGQKEDPVSSSRQGVLFAWHPLSWDCS